MPARCRSCGKAIIWATTSVAMRAMPLDFTPTENGNIVLTDGVAVVTKEKAEGELLYTSHFATCPFAKKYRKKK